MDHVRVRPSGLYAPSSANGPTETSWTVWTSSPLSRVTARQPAWRGRGVSWVRRKRLPHSTAQKVRRIWPWMYRGVLL